MAKRADMKIVWVNMLPIIAVVSPMITAFILSIGVVTFLVVNPLNARIDKVETRVDRLEFRMEQRFDALTEIVLSIKASP